MQLDSHRRQFSFTPKPHPQPLPLVETPDIPTSVNMPCPRSRSRCSHPKTFTAEDGTEMQTWHSIRREQLRNMRRMVLRVVLYMSLLEAIRQGPDSIIFAGKNGYPERGAGDFGIAYVGSYVLSYIFLCVFSIIWYPLFSWWVPTSSPDSKTGKKLDKFASTLQQISLVLLPVSIALSLGEYLFWTITTVIFVDARPVDTFQLPKNTRKNWLARLMLLVGIFVSTTFGYGMFQILGEADLAHVKCVEYMIIVMPIQINIGVLLGSLMQWKMEQRLARKTLVISSLEEGNVDEKQALLV